jgi:hypothetical protein
MNKNGIIAYGTAEDREKLAAIVAELKLKSGSAWIISQIRAKHQELFGK